MKTAYCLDCDHPIQLGDRFQVGYAIECPHCDSEFKLVNLDPPKIEWMYDEWGDDYEDEDDDWEDDYEEEEGEESWSWMLAKHKRVNVADQVQASHRDQDRPNKRDDQAQTRNRDSERSRKYESGY